MDTLAFFVGAVSSLIGCFIGMYLAERYEDHHDEEMDHILEALDALVKYSEYEAKKRQ